MKCVPWALAKVSRIMHIEKCDDHYGHIKQIAIKLSSLSWASTVGRSEWACINASVQWMPLFLCYFPLRRYLSLTPYFVMPNFLVIATSLAVISMLFLSTCSASKTTSISETFHPSIDECLRSSASRSFTSTTSQSKQKLCSQRQSRIFIEENNIHFTFTGKSQQNHRQQMRTIYSIYVSNYLFNLICLPRLCESRGRTWLVLVPWSHCGNSNVLEEIDTRRTR